MAMTKKKRAKAEQWKVTHEADVSSGSELRQLMEDVFFWYPEVLDYRKDVPVTVTENGLENSTQVFRKSAKRLIERLRQLFDSPQHACAYYAISDWQTKNMAVIAVRIVRNRANEPAIDLLFSPGMSDG